MNKPINVFNDAWARCDMLSATHAYLSKSTTKALNSDELLRAEWVARISALDLYIHELVAGLMVEIFIGNRPSTPAFNKFMLSNDAINRIMNASNQTEAGSIFDLEVRRQLGFVTYQGHESIADGIRLVSSVELWNSIASHYGATGTNHQKKAKEIKGQLSAIVSRRNQIAHEGDMQPTAPRTPWPIHKNDLEIVREFIKKLVLGIDAIVN
ncbi:HEPN domain-containing protein [Pseudaeromonas sharmana]|uniref:HEPN domain-containing protein n=1 Tax=Pseudaeromonas sharmana TaxID=328412 RepID=A0ABV8CN24_9GAMM